MSPALAHRFAGAVLAMLLITACAVMERGRPAPTSTDVRLETTSRSAPGSTSDHSALQRVSIVNAVDETDTGPKTERAVGIVAVVTVFSVFTLFIIAVYKVVQLLSN